MIFGGVSTGGGEFVIPWLGTAVWTAGAILIGSLALAWLIRRRA